MFNLSVLVFADLLISSWFFSDDDDWVVVSSPDIEKSVIQTDVRYSVKLMKNFFLS